MAPSQARGYLRGMDDTEQWLAQRAFQRRQTALAGAAGTMLVLGLANISRPNNMDIWVPMLGLAVVSGGLWLVRRLRHAKGS
jgi:hypothetical protein